MQEKQVAQSFQPVFLTKHRRKFLTDTQATKKRKAKKRM